MTEYFYFHFDYLGEDNEAGADSNDVYDDHSRRISLETLNWGR